MIMIYLSWNWENGSQCNSVAKKKRKEKKSSIFFWMHAADSEEQHIAAYSSETVDSKNS